ncbi:hypothetical protein B7463_g3958, partial [Scytalidium lignicola]
MGSIETQQSFYASGKYIPPDAIFEVTKSFFADPHPKKVNLGQGTYRDEFGRPWVLPSVQMAKEKVANCGHEYLPIAGLQPLRERAIELVFHDTRALEEGRLASCQSLSGTGALSLAGLALKQCNPSLKTIYITDPTWSNHELLFSSLGFEVKKLPYYNDGKFDMDSYMSVLRTTAPGSILILHACAHNPTGCDPSKAQWKEIAAVIQQRKIFPIFDSAYLGFNSGSVDEDAWAIKHFVEELGMEASICLSFAKSMGLYGKDVHFIEWIKKLTGEGERIGLVTFVTQSVDLTRTMNSILANCQRATVSSPPVYGAQIVATVLSNPEIKAQWDTDLITMSSRIRTMRKGLYEELLRLETPGDWSHIVNQSGMFCYTGLTPRQIGHLNREYHIYMADTSRISIAGLNEGNLEYFAQAIDQTYDASSLRKTEELHTPWQGQA